MSASQNPLDIAAQAERDLNSHKAKVGSNGSDSTIDSGIDESATNKFPGSTVRIGGGGQGDNRREIPVEEGGDVAKTGRLTKAKDFEGEGGPEDKQAAYAADNAGNNDVRDNIRQGGETRRP